MALVAIAASVGLAVRRRHRGATGTARSGSLRLGHPAFVVGIVLLVANGLSPYLGLKTATSFNMFSNLRTEPGYWNHALVPEAVRIFPFQDDLVAGTNAGEQGDGVVWGKIGRFQPVPMAERPGC